MCAPVSVATQGASGGCVGVCQVWPQITGMVVLASVLVWNFRGFIGKRLGFGKVSA